MSHARNKKITPLFLIDTSKVKDYPYDYIYCDDSRYRFIAKIILLDKEQTKAVFRGDNILVREIEQGGIALVIEKFICPLVQMDQKVIQSLLKKAVKKYLLLYGR